MKGNKYGNADLISIRVMQIILIVQIEIETEQKTETQ